MKDSISKSEYETLAAFRYALRQFLCFSEEAAGQVGLTPQQHQALLAIKGYPQRDRITIRELAERLRIRHHSAVGLVNRLAAQGFLEREADEIDRRQVYISLAPRGQAALEKLSAVHREELQRIGPQLSRLLNSLLTINEK